ncbi:trypsin delta-like [Anopheles ziemanni]|uniref:trypsin delta-like n=1 Tax=Anopheles coustani TaxID=139045 RepID=UPI0026586CFA|nr:trypsin delta-like [Anopheles coustani]XP_058171470.1 trypsin delta-like [Anopheles ziemanni]
MRVALLSFGLLCLLKCSVGQSQNFFDFFFDIENKRQNGRIVGGAAVTIAKYPYIVSIRRNTVHICAGSVISTYYAVTCAHCTYTMSIPQVTIYGGSTSRNTGGKQFKVTEIVVHPNFDTDTIDNDISVLRVSTPFVPNTNIAPVSLVAADYSYPNGAIAYVAGWGRITIGNSPSSLSASLRAVNIPFVDDVSCQNLWSNKDLTDSMVCAGIKGRDACIGDSGGPLVVASPTNANVNLLAGIVSWGSSACGSEYPGVYTKINAPAIRSFLAAYV